MWSIGGGFRTVWVKKDSLEGIFTPKQEQNLLKTGTERLKITFFWFPNLKNSLPSSKEESQFFHPDDRILGWLPRPFEGQNSPFEGIFTLKEGQNLLKTGSERLKITFFWFPNLKNSLLG